MEDSLYDDVKALLDIDSVDDKILKQILRACENNEIISNNERNYVRGLAEKHLGKSPSMAQTETSANDESIPDVVMPDVVIPDVVMPDVVMPDVIMPNATIPQTINVQKKPIIKRFLGKIPFRNQKKSRIIIGLSIVVLAIIIGASSSLPDDFTFGSDDSTDVLLSIKSDLLSYSSKDLISISGTSESSGTVNVSIETQDGKLIWSEQVSIKSDGSFSTLTIAGGLGWEDSGTYFLKVDDREETISSTFSFTA